MADKTKAHAATSSPPSSDVAGADAQKAQGYSVDDVPGTGATLSAKMDAPVGSVAPATSASQGAPPSSHPTAAATTDTGLVAATPTVPAMHENQAAPTSGPVAELRSMFPDVDVSIIEAVLAAHDNDPSHCVSDLLAMTDPEYKPSTADTADSDAELARQLAAEDDARYPTQNQGVTSSGYGQYTNLPYQPRVRPNHGAAGGAAQQGHLQQSGQGGQPGLSPGGKDEIQKLQEEFTKFAGVGKKTMSEWFGKAKAKVAELQQSRAEQKEVQAEMQGTAASSYAQSQSPYNWGGSDSDQRSPVGGAAHRPSAGGADTSRGPPKPSRLTGNLPYGSRYDAPGTANNKPVNPSIPILATGTPGAAKPPAQDLSHLGLGQKKSVSLYGSDQPGSSSAPATAAGSGDAVKAAALGAGAGLAGGAAVAVASKEKEKDDDEESLEYTRNPFEDDD